MPLEAHRNCLRSTALVCVALLVPGDITIMAQGPSPPTAAEAPKPISADELDSLIAPIALYPDPLLAQVLAASTYPLELIQLQQWLAKHKDLKDKALADAVKKETWDPSIQAMAGLPDVVKQLADNIKWTSELGDAFLAQQKDVMDAVQRMRAKAKDSGKLKSGDQIKVETKVVESKSVVVIEQSNPQVVYVPSYDPVVVWGAAPVYAYPPVYYPPAGYYAAGMALSFGVGVAMGAMWSGGWGWNAGWGGGNNNININNNNNFNRNSRTNIGSGNVGSGNSSWKHNPQHRGGAPYGDRATAQQFGGTARGDSASTRQANARQNAGQRGGGQQASVGNRAASGAGNAGANRGGAGGDRVGNRQVSSGGSSRSGGAFEGANRGGSAARSSSSRGSSSFGGGGGGGARRSGGGRRR
jgi:hypothetical protein